MFLPPCADSFRHRPHVGISRPAKRGGMRQWRSRAQHWRFRRFRQFCRLRRRHHQLTPRTVNSGGQVINEHRRQPIHRIVHQKRKVVRCIRAGTIRNTRQRTDIIQRSRFRTNMAPRGSILSPEAIPQCATLPRHRQIIANNVRHISFLGKIMRT